MSDEIPDAQHRKLWAMVVVVGAHAIPALKDASGGPARIDAKKEIWG